MNTDFLLQQKDQQDDKQTNTSIQSEKSKYLKLFSYNLQDQIYKKPIFRAERPQKTFITIDQALDYTGDNSTYSKRVLYFMGFFWFWYSVLIMGLPLLQGGKLHFFCPSQDDNIYTECKYEQACGNFQAKELLIQPRNNIISEFNLVCDRSYLVAWISSIVYFSNIISGFIFPYLSDKKGRKFSLIFSGIIASLSLIGAGLVESFNIWILLIFIAGFCFGGIEIVGRVYLSEISGIKFRFNSQTVLNIIWAFSQVILGIIVNLISWRYLFTYGLGLSFFVSILLASQIFYQSPRYLLSLNPPKINEAKRILKKVTNINNRPPFKYHLDHELCLMNKTYYTVKNEAYFSMYRKASLKVEMIREKSLKWTNFFKIFALWGIYFFNYFGIQYSVFVVSDLVWLNFSLLGLVEMLGMFFSGFLLKKYNRLKVMKICLLTSGLCCCLTSQKHLRISMFLILSKLIMSLSCVQPFFIMYFQYTVLKFFQLNIEHKVLHIVFYLVSKLKRAAASVMPFVLTFFWINYYLNPILILSALFFCAFFINFFLIETTKAQKPELQTVLLDLKNEL